jgi:hypothetical protein
VDDDTAQLQWRNHLFERVDSSGQLLKGAQQHHAPRGLAKSAAARSS